MTDISDRVRIESTEALSQRKYLLRLLTLQWHRSDGNWQEQKREIYDKGNGAAILLYNRARRSVVLIPPVPPRRVPERLSRAADRGAGRHAGRRTPGGPHPRRGA